MNRPLALTVLIMLLAMLAALVGLVVDPRVITGAPAWLKPLKFAVSISIYATTFIWLLSFIQGHRRVVRLIAWVSATGVLIEIVLIAEQVVRGTTSHFNVGTRFDAAVCGSASRTPRSPGHCGSASSSVLSGWASPSS